MNVDVVFSLAVVTEAGCFSGLGQLASWEARARGQRGSYFGLEEAAPVFLADWKVGHPGKMAAILG